MGEIEKMKQEDVEAITNRQENTTTSVNDSKDKKKQRKKLGKLDKLVIGVGGTIIATTLYLFVADTCGVHMASKARLYELLF